MQIPVMDIRGYDRFEKGDKVYESRSKTPTAFGNWVFLTAWDITMPRGTKEELKFHKGEIVSLTGYWITGDKESLKADHIRGDHSYKKHPECTDCKG